MRKLELQKNFIGEIEARINNITVARTAGEVLTIFKEGIREFGIFYFDGFQINGFGGLDRNIEKMSFEDIETILKMVFHAE